MWKWSESGGQDMRFWDVFSGLSLNSAARFHLNSGNLFLSEMSKYDHEITEITYCKHHICAPLSSQKSELLVLLCCCWVYALMLLFMRFQVNILSKYQNCFGYFAWDEFSKLLEHAKLFCNNYLSSLWIFFWWIISQGEHTDDSGWLHHRNVQRWSWIWARLSLADIVRMILWNIKEFLKYLYRMTTARNVIPFS